ncbi:amidohydrolase [Myxococcota bacterium]|nr:amidohydrolase [Myxococcota bacterium]
MKAVRILAGIGAALGLACATTPQDPADSIYFGANVITMDERDTRARAVAIRRGRIAAVGSRGQAMALRGPDTHIVDLEGMTVVPGFIDGHSHLSLVAQTRAFMADLNSPPIGRNEDVADVVDALHELAQTVPDGQWVVGMGYDDTLLAENRHPDRWDLDRASDTHPILALHVSGHLGVLNSLALERAGITRDSPQPQGGHIRFDPETGEPTGVLEEMAALVPALMQLPQPPLAARIAAIESAAEQYASQGVTTAQDGGTGLATFADFLAADAAGRLPIRLLVFPAGDALEPLLAGELDAAAPDRDRIALGPVKLIADGSIQGYTGYLRDPYHVPHHGDPNYRGYPGIDREALARTVTKIHAAGRQVAVHGNGDASIDDILSAMDRAQAVAPRQDARPVIIHAQMARDDQLDIMRELGVVPSFFVLHTYYWGDRHRDIFLGPERARRISPTRSARDRGVPFSIHTDAPIVPMDTLLLMWSAVNRTTTGGAVLGPEQRLTPLEALRAVTIDAAWQYFLEEDRGSIEPGKLADLVVLSDDPLNRPDDMHRIEVVSTLVGGKPVYTREAMSTP